MGELDSERTEKEELQAELEAARKAIMKMKFSNDSLKAAVKEWCEDSGKAEAKYGNISLWDTSAVTSMENLFCAVEEERFDAGLAAKQFNDDIYFDQAADYFKAKAKGKKKKKGGDDDGAKAGPDLKRFMKDLMIYKNQALMLEDRVVVIGACTNPEDADVKQLKHTGKGKPEKQGFFEKFLFFPYPGYPDRVMLWKHFVKKCLNGEGGKKEVPDNFDISSLAHISEGYSAGAIYKAVRQTLTPRRVQSIEGGKSPLTETEFINALARQEVTYQSDAKKYMDFTCKITDLDKRKKEKEDAKKKEEGGGDDKKGKKKK